MFKKKEGREEEKEEEREGEGRKLSLKNCSTECIVREENLNADLISLHSRSPLQPGTKNCSALASGYLSVRGGKIA